MQNEIVMWLKKLFFISVPFDTDWITFTQYKYYFYGN